MPKLREEKNPELAPISPLRHEVKTPPVQYTRNVEREKKIAEDVKKRRRPAGLGLAPLRPNGLQ